MSAKLSTLLKKAGLDKPPLLIAPDDRFPESSKGGRRIGSRVNDPRFIDHTIVVFDQTPAPAANLRAAIIAMLRELARMKRNEQPAAAARPVEKGT